MSVIHNDGRECGGGKCAHHMTGKKENDKTKAKAKKGSASPLRRSHLVESLT